jgi:hypothetical protein
MDAETNHLPETSSDEDVLMGLLGDKADADDNADIRSESSISNYGDDDDTVVTTSETKSLSSTSLEVLPNESIRRSIFSKHWKATNPSSPYGQPDPTVQRSSENQPLAFMVLLATDISANRIATTTCHSVGHRTP